MEKVKIVLETPKFGKALSSVLLNIRDASARRASELGVKTMRVPSLVATSRAKPTAALQQAYEYGQRHFGENYVQELQFKAQRFEHEGIKDVQWHFIGQLQEDKTELLCDTPNLFMVQTVSSIEMANALNNSWERKEESNPLNVMVQVNTTQLDSTNGCTPVQGTHIAEHIHDKCPNLHFSGLMTVGSSKQSAGNVSIADFLCLTECKQHVMNALGLMSNQVEMSMGMSHDYETAIEYGSDYVRVGSSIFGKTKQKLV